jgi:hypothetical protein
MKALLLLHQPAPTNLCPDARRRPRTSFLGPSRSSAPDSIGRAAPLECGSPCRARHVRTRTPLGTQRTTRSNVGHKMWRDRVWRGRAGQAFQFDEPGVVDGATTDSSPQTAAGLYRMTRPPRRSSSQGTARGFWIRAWGQHEPAFRETGRSNRSALWRSELEGGLDIPATHPECRFLQQEHALRTLTRVAWSRAGRIEKCRLTSLDPLCRRAVHGSSAHRTRPWPRSHSPRGMVGRFPEAPISWLTRKAGLSNG